MHTRKASLIALQLRSFSDTLASQTQRSFLESMAVNLAARISAMDRTSGQAEQRRQSLAKLSQRLLQQISRMQSPADCSAVKYIVTSLPKCGFGCQAHYAAVALRLALAHNRTLFIDDNAWYDIYLPVTTCPKPSLTADVRVLGDIYNTLDPMSPPGLTLQWANTLRGLHESP